MAHSRKNTRSDLALPPAKQRWDDAQGRYYVHESIIVAHEDNPPPNKGDEPKKLQRLIESIRSDDHGGIHLPVSGFIHKGLFHLIEGHRRLFASRHVIADMLAGVIDGQPMPDTEKFEWIPVSIEPPQSKLAVLIRMQSSDALKDEWDLKGKLDHIRHIYEEYQLEKERKIPIDELPESLAQAIGWNIEKMRIMLQISQSKTLTTAVGEYESCTYRGWYHVVQIANLLIKERPALIEQIAGIKATSKVALREAVYKLMVGKVQYYVASKGQAREKKKKAQPGALLERCAPAIRDERFPAARVTDWLTKDIDLTPNGVERMTEASHRRKEIEKFIKAFSASPKATDEELKASIHKMSDTDAADAHEDAEIMGQEHDAGTATSKDVEQTLDQKIHVSEHDRAQPKPASVVKDNTVLIQLPRTKENAFNEIVPQITELLQKAEVCDGFTPQQQAIVQTVITVLDSGLKRAKSA